MKWMLRLCLCLLPLIVQAGSWKITKQTSPFAYTVDMAIHDEKGNEIAKVQRTGLATPRYFYDLYDQDHAFAGRGVTRIFSLGMLYSWASEIDIYDEDDAYLGLIQGKWFSHSRASFAFYDERGNCEGYAYLHDKKPQFLLWGNDKSGMPFAELEGKTCGDSALWQMSLNNVDPPFDSRILAVFCGFVCDNQAEFLYRPPQVHYHYHYDSKSK